MKLGTYAHRDKGLSGVDMMMMMMLIIMMLIIMMMIIMKDLVK